MTSLFKIRMSAVPLICVLIVIFGSIENASSEETLIVRPPTKPRPGAPRAPMLTPRSIGEPTPPSIPKEGELKCEVAMQRLLQASDYGTSLGGLKPHVKMQSFKVADVKHGMKVATDVIAKIPNATPEQQRLIEQAKALLLPFDEAQDKHDQARDELDDLQALREKVQNLANPSADLTVTLGEIDRKIQLASASVRSTNEVVEKTQKIYLDFLDKNGLIFDNNTTGNSLVPRNSLKRSMSEAVSFGDVADASKRIDFIERTIGRSGLPIPFDEILVIRGQSLADRKKIIDQFKELLPDREEIQSLMGYIDELSRLFVSSSLSPTSKSEIDRVIKKSEQRLKKLEEKNPKQIMDQLLIKLDNERPLTVLKSSGVIVGAIADGSLMGASVDPAEFMSRGFWCRDSKTVSGGWYHKRGMLSIEMCQRDSRIGLLGLSCRDAMNFNYHRPAGPPNPAKSPPQNTNTVR